MQSRSHTLRSWIIAGIGTTCLLLISAGLVHAAPFLYVANFAGDTVSVVDTATNIATKTLAIGNGPVWVAAHPSGRFVYVSTRLDGHVAVIDTATQSVLTTIGVGNNPGNLVFHPTAATAYVLNSSDNSLSVIDTNTHTVLTTIPIVNGANGLTIHPNGNTLYVSDGNNQISVIDANSLTLTDTIALGGGPTDLTMHPSGSFLYVTLFLTDRVVRIDTSTLLPTGSIFVQLQPNDQVVRPDGAFLYVTNAASNTVSVINTATFSVVATVPITELAPSGIDVHPNGNTLYVASGISGFVGTVTVVDTGSNTVIDTVIVGDGTAGLAVAPIPPCSIDVDLGYSGGNFQMDFVIRSDEPITWNAWLSYFSTTSKIFQVELPALPNEFPIATISFPLPAIGQVGVLSNLANNDGMQCSVYKVINTGL